MKGLKVVKTGLKKLEKYEKDKVSAKQFTNAKLKAIKIII